MLVSQDHIFEVGIFDDADLFPANQNSLTFFLFICYYRTYFTMIKFSNKLASLLTTMQKVLSIFLKLVICSALSF